MKHDNGALTPQNLNEFDFSLPQLGRNNYKRENVADAFATIGVKGHTRKTNNHSVSFTAFADKVKSSFIPETVSIGTGKFKRVFLVVFNNANLPHEKISIYGPERGRQHVVASKSLTRKIFSILSVEPPEMPDTSTRVYFNLVPIPGQPKVYTIEPVRAIRYDASKMASVYNYK